MAQVCLGLQICTFVQPFITWFIISANCGSLLSSTRFSQVISRIQRNGLGGQAFRSRAAPPVERHQWESGQLVLYFLEIYFPNNKKRDNHITHKNGKIRK